MTKQTEHDNHFNDTINQALDRGVAVTVTVGDLSVTYTPVTYTPVDQLRVEPKNEPEPMPDGLAADVRFHNTLPGFTALTAKFQEGSIEHAGRKEPNAIILAYDDRQAVDVITQLLSIVEEVTDRAFVDGITPVDFDGLIRGMVDDFDAEEANGCCG